MLVTFYDKENKTKLNTLNEMPVVPCANDIVMIDHKWYRVVNRAFILDKKYNVCVYVKPYTKK